MSDTQTVKKVLEVEDKFTKPMNDFKKGLGDVAKKSNEADKKLEGANDEIKKTGNNSKKATPKVKSFADSFEDVAGSVKGFVMAYAGVKGLNISYDLAMLGAEAESVELAFARQAEAVGYYSDTLTSKMSTATGNMVSDIALQKNAMKALVAGIDPESMLVSMQYVSRYAQSVGADSEQLMQTVMTGLARGSAQFLDDVGIQVMGSSDVVGDAVEQMKEKMMELDDIPLTNIKQFQTTVENLKVELGSYFTPVLDDLVTLMGDLMGTVSPEQADRLGESFGLIIGGIAKSFAVMGAGVDQVLSTINHRINQTLLFTTSLGEGFQEVALGILKVSEFIDNVLTPKDYEEYNVSTAMIEGIEASQAKVEELSLQLAKQLLEEEAGAEARQQIWKDYVLGVDRAIEKQKELAEVSSGGGGGGGITNTLEDLKLEKEGISAVTTAEEIRLGTLGKLITQKEKIRLENAQELLDLAELTEARREMIAQAITTGGEMFSAMSTISSAKMNALKQEFDYEEERIKNSTMSRKKKEKALEGLAKKRKDAEIEQAKRQVAFSALLGATNTALAIQNGIVAITGVAKDQAGGFAIRAGAMLAMAGAVATQIAQVKSAQANIPKREHGGVMRKDELYEVAERNKDEVIEQGGRSYTVRSSGGRAHPNTGNGGSTTVNMNVSFGAGTDTATIEERLPSMIAKGLKIADRQGEIEWGGMGNFQREIGN